MGVNLLAARRLRQMSAATGMTIIWAWVLSHQESGRYARLTTDDHRHGWFDRHTGDVTMDDPDDPDDWYARHPHATSCERLFGENT